MSILNQLTADITQALKNRAALAVLTLRQTKTALDNAAIANGRQPLSAEQELKVLRSEIKKRRDAIELYQRGGRAELAQKEQQEIDIISRYLPPELSEADIRAAVKATIARLGASSPKDMGKVVGAVVAEFKGAADGSVVSRLAKEELDNK